MYIADAKFEEHCLNIFRVIECCAVFSGTNYDFIALLICIIQKREYLQNEKRYAKKENVILLYSEKFQSGSNYFFTS